jgi:hypothetical protein
MNRCVSILVIALLVPSFASAEDYTPPDNVQDPARQAKDQSSDLSLPFLYLEPHDFCYDITRPMPVTLSAVNRSKKPLTLDWQAFVASLLLEPVGPGHVTPVLNRAAPESVLLASMELAQFTIDLEDCFEIEGAGVYRLSYVRPMEDGRIHLAVSAQFVIEDDAAVDEFAAILDAGPARDTFSALLKDNPIFAVGGGAKTYGWDDQRWRARPQMLRSQWDEPLAVAQQLWRAEIDMLTKRDSPAGHGRATVALVDRLLLLSDRFRVEPGSDFANRVGGWSTTYLPPREQEQLLLTLVRSHSRYVVSRSMNRLASQRSEAALDELFRIGDGPDRELAAEALSSLSDYAPNPRIAQYLRRKMVGVDRNVALAAARSPPVTAATFPEGHWSCVA